MRYTKVGFKSLDCDTPLSFFMGSALRGAFGYSLKKVVCINPSFACENCFARDNCLFFDFYEKKDSYHKYRFDISLEPKSFDFNLYLFVDACEKLPYIISSLHKMLGENGIGRDRITTKKFTLHVNDKLVYNGADFDLSGNHIKEFNLDTYHKDIALKFITPFRTKQKNRLLKELPPLELILSSVQNRKNSLQNQKIKKLEFTPTYELIKSDTCFKELTRLSNRQKTKMQFGGIMGEIEYKNIDKKSYELLKLGEIIGIGKQCVFGLGKIKVEDI
jgi:CRISPR-associated endoribonuclease Cas6